MRRLDATRFSSACCMSGSAHRGMPYVEYIFLSSEALKDKRQVYMILLPVSIFLH